ncbi:MAG TPA: response regulator [Candidatus Acidoferrum sp.]|nr:response regulator [Candidatus Acidoferrum sp.]
MNGANSIVLYVEDEETDRFLMERAFAKEGLQAVLRMVEHGRAAIEYLSGDGAYARREDHPLPGVVLLDLNLPEVHGFEVLKWIRAHPVHAGLPVVVFTSSERPEDRERAALLGANEYWQKPGSPALLREVARKLHDRWLCAGSLESAA